MLKLFFAGPDRQLQIREVARQTGLSPRGAQMILESLCKEGLLISESNNVVNNYKGNFDDKRFVGLKRSLNLYLIENIKDQNANFINSLANGIVLSGYMEAV